MEPSLDDAALTRLREAVRNVRDHAGGAVPHGDVVALGACLGPESCLTLDLRASEAIGVPLLVVRPAPPALAELTPREREVARLIAEGLTNKGIAHRLGLSPATVKDHVHHILRKTGLLSRAAVATLHSGA